VTEDAVTTVTSTATPTPPATRDRVLNSADARPVSAEEMVENEAAWIAMLHQAMEDPLQNASTRISHTLVVTSSVKPNTHMMQATPIAPARAIRRGPLRG
jgi:hypothetical protein